MRLELDGVTIGDEPTPALPTLDAVLTDGAPTLVAVGTERGPMLASLIAGGRMLPDRGTVRLDGDEPTRSGSAAPSRLVDTPMASEPTPAVPVGSWSARSCRCAGLPRPRGARSPTCSTTSASAPGARAR